MGTGADRLYEMLAWNHALAGKIAGRDFPQHAFEHLQKWQQTRLTRTFEDLMQQDAYRPAITFFLTELYGGLDFRERDQEMSKVMPVMKRFLPDKVLYIMSEAFELQAVSLEFDIEMAEYMERLDVPDLDMNRYCEVYRACSDKAGDMNRYCEVYRACSDKAGRERQILLIRKLGYDLDRLVNKPMVNFLVRLLRGPAHAAGFGKLQEFLESGLGSFRKLGDVRYFNEIIYQREWDSMQKLFAGEAEPFGF